jgi:hypothetical protein
MHLNKQNNNLDKHNLLKYLILQKVRVCMRGGGSVYAINYTLNLNY